MVEEAEAPDRPLHVRGHAAARSSSSPAATLISAHLDPSPRHRHPPRRGATVSTLVGEGERSPPETPSSTSSTRASDLAYAIRPPLGRRSDDTGALRGDGAADGTPHVVPARRIAGYFARGRPWRRPRDRHRRACRPTGGNDTGPAPRARCSPSSLAGLPPRSRSSSTRSAKRLGSLPASEVAVEHELPKSEGRAAARRPHPTSRSRSRSPAGPRRRATPQRLMVIAEKVARSTSCSSKAPRITVVETRP